MRRRLSLVLAAFLLLPFLSLASPKGATQSKSSKTTTSKSSSSTTSKKTVHVKEYKRKDGTVVKAHDRAAPGTATPKSSTPKPKTTTPKVSTPKKTTGASTVAARDSNGRIKRSASAKSAFMKQTGYPNGRGGYVVDHIIPLQCGGADDPSNMQWQAVADAKIKDRTEAACRR